ncbi:hypothetical protein SAMN05443574_103329 [Haloarcula vallismortis]|uniref:Uncharacterized protein n=2 Tax=Haloarcula vallismortis TaxID=28442 RepID=M0JVC3_HALVA|nr:hypothetical protein [Haloarcula vallismortis]EMA11590.1 hypothetical protein C437_01720 [Haloarcula vallismortis ATCC 29715]SDW45698.1 hypothetical protein SAMN05443574_103329 [Haloarcula vallismortis]
MQQVQKAPEGYSKKFELDKDTDLLDIRYPQIGYKIHVPKILYEKKEGSYIRYVRTFCGQEDEMLVNDLETLRDNNYRFCRSCTRYASKKLGFDFEERVQELMNGGENP